MHNASVHTRNRLVVGAETAKDFFQRIRHFAHRGAQTHGLYRQVEQVALAGLGALGQCIQCGLNGGAIAGGTDLLQTGHLGFTDGVVIDIKDIDGVFLGQFIFVHANNDVLAGVNAGLLVSRTGFDLHLGPARFNGFGHATHGFDFFDDAPGLVGHILGEFFHHVGTSPRIDHVGDVGFFLNDQLRVAGNTGREFGWQGNGFIQCIGMQRLGAAKNGCHCFDRGTYDVVVRVLLGQ